MTKMFAAAALTAAFAVPMAAHASTTITADDFFTPISAGAFFTGGGTITQENGTAEFGFRASEALRVEGVLLSGNGPAPNVEQINVSVTPEGSNGPFSEVRTFGRLQEGVEFSSDFFVLQANETFTILFQGTVTQNVNVDFTFETTSTVPLPAAGGMLLLTMLAGGIASRRKNKKA